MGLGIGSFTGKNIRTGVEKMALVSSNHWTSVEKGTLISTLVQGQGTQSLALLL
jgi:hypothetical protein